MVQLRQVAQMQVWFSRPVICDILQTNLKHPIPLLVYPAPFQRRVTIETGGFRAIEIKIGEGDL